VIAQVALEGADESELESSHQVQRLCARVCLAISPQAGNVVPDPLTVAEYEANLDCNDRGRGTGASPHNQRRWARRRRLSRGRLRRRLLWWWLLSRRRLLWRRLGLGCWLGLLRLWLGDFSWLRRAGLLLRRRVLRIRPGLRCARVRRSGVCRAGLYHAGLRNTGLQDSGLRGDTGSHKSGRLEHNPGNDGFCEAGLCRGSHSDLYRPDLRRVSKPVSTEGCSRHLHPASSHAGLDTAACPGSGSDLQLDDATEHDFLLRQQPVAG
jgi:hypothetical protein